MDGWQSGSMPVQDGFATMSQRAVSAIERQADLPAAIAAAKSRGLH